MMDAVTLTAFFKWCTLVNAGVFLLWALLWLAAPDLVFRTQSRFFPLDRDRFGALFYGFLGLFKLGVIFFNAVPWIALEIVT